MKHSTTEAKLIISFYILLNVFVVAAMKLNYTFGMELLSEDRIIENITAIALLAGALYILYKASQNIRYGNKLQGILQFVLSLALIFMSGEEISWGQRIFNWETTGIFKKGNLQGETNFHNMKINGVKLNKVIFTYLLTAMGAFGFLISPWLYKKSAGFANFINRLGITLPAYKHTLLLGIGLVFTLFIEDSKKWELWECNAAIVIFWTAFQPLNKDRIYNSLRR